jgi:hypothetical protein
MPNWSPLSTPAWDPSSCTPGTSSDSPTFLPGPSRHSLSQCDEVRHPLLDSRLLGIKLSVLVNGGRHTQKELVANLTLVNGHLSIRHHFYNTSEALSPEWVSPKHPHLTRDNGLLVVIKGEHCGKYVRRIHHRYEGETTIIILAVVTRAEGFVDTLTGETLELEAEDLCVGSETKEEKQWNQLIMMALCEQARKKRAK